jgi:hypothetical protein
MRLVDRILDSRAAVFAACGVSLAIGLFFVFVWTPLPWGWQGIDLYYEIALTLARGAPFPTIHLVWGYAYFLAFWYWLFGDHPWIPLCVQVAANATIPWMMYEIVRRQIDRRVAVATALLVGVGSFNTLYAATQASDAMCTVLVVALMLCLVIADERRTWPWFAATGALAGVAYQFRPNLVLFPLFLAAAYVALRRFARQAVRQGLVLLVVFAAAGAPWVVRNYRWTGLFVPASSHGGVQLWFGTLQAGAYEDSWIYNPRAAFENPPVDYTSVVEQPIEVTAKARACQGTSPTIDLVWWTGRDATRHRESARPAADTSVHFTIPAQPAATAIYYYLQSADGPMPIHGDVAPAMFVVSQNHLGDLDVDGYVLDIYDLVSMLRHVAWHEPVPDAARLDLDRDGAVTERDLRTAVTALLHDREDADAAHDEVDRIDSSAEVATIQLRDGSSVGVTRHWSGKMTDLPLHTVGVGSFAAQLVSRSRAFNRLHESTVGESQRGRCIVLTDIAANRVPYRRLPHEMRRFEALALDNIEHDPLAYLKASARRAVRVFVIEGSDDTRTAYQFGGARRIYAIGRAASLAYLAMVVAGLVVAVRRRLRVALLLLPFVYVPATICFMLINARYSMTAQPFGFAFVALAIVTGLDVRSRRAPAAATRSRAEGSDAARGYR